MAVEIAVVRTFGKGRNSWKQAIYINESDLDGPLSEVRTIIAKQDIEVPKDYRFLSISGNVVPWPVEETLLLRDIASSPSKNEQQRAVKSEVPDPGDDFDNDIFRLKVKIPELWIAAHRDFLESNDDANTTNSKNETCGCNHANVLGGNQEMHDKMAKYAKLCPWKAFDNFTHNGDGSRKIFKLMFFFVAILFLLMVALVLTTHVLFGLLSAVTSHPDFPSVVSRLRSDRGGSEEMTSLRLKVSELELSWKFKFDQLNDKLMELEDLYLNDLAKHKREMAFLRNQHVDDSGSFASQRDFENLQARVVEVSEYVNMQQATEAGKRKKGKKIKETEEL